MTRRAAAVASTALAVVLVAGCTGDPDTRPPTASATGSETTNPTGSPSPTLQDRSAELLGGAAPLGTIASTTALPSSTFAGSTFTIHRLTRSTSSTLLVWSVTGASGSAPTDANVRAWEKYPRLVAGGKRYSVVTFDKQSDGWSALSDPSLGLDEGQPTPPQSALYPPLPAGTTQVTLEGPWFTSVIVPVSDAATPPTG